MSAIDADTDREHDLFTTWRVQVEAELRGASFSSLYSQSLAGLTIDPLYVASDEAGASIAAPAPWRVMAEVSGPDPALAAARARAACDQGAEDLWIEAGPDHGVHLLSAGDLALVLEGVDLARVGVCLEPKGNAFALTAALLAVADARGVSRDALRGGLGVDPFGLLASAGSLHTGLRGALAEAVELAVFAQRELPHVCALRVDVTHFHEAGAHRVSQLAWALSTGIAYLRALMDAGMSAEDAAKSLEFVLPVTGELLPEVAKLRAMRLLWGKVLRAVGVARVPGGMRLTARGARRCRSRRDPWVNMLRGTLELVAGALGGAGAILLPPLDDAFGTHDPRASRSALMAHQVLRDEAKLARVLDPLAGSYALEALTSRVARVAWEEMQELEARGGMLAGLRSGSLRRAVSFTTQARWRRISSRRQTLVGVNRFANLEEQPLPKPPEDSGEWLHELGRRITASSPEDTQLALMGWARALAKPPEARGGLAAAAVDSVAKGVDLFSLTALLREGRPSLYLEPLHRWRDAEGFEAFRDESDRWLARRGRRPCVRLLGLGDVVDYEPRAAWVEALFATGGVCCVREAWERGRDPSTLEPSDGLLLCGSDQAYQDFGVEAARDLFAAGVPSIGRIGPPGEDAEHWQQAGLVHSFHEGLDAIQMLAALWESFGETP
ncbi:MAG: hypothetical protein GXP55_21135 [Deltaproteobacteria bacterium]|nr:hypothetical protein [Deltaproteobacteria bacterium]